MPGPPLKKLIKLIFGVSRSRPEDFREVISELSELTSNPPGVPAGSLPFEHSYTDTTRPSHGYTGPQTRLTVPLKPRRTMEGRVIPGKPLPMPPEEFYGWRDRPQPRHRVTEFALRGDKRSPREIYDARGFHPRERRILDPRAHDPGVHRGEPRETVFISFTRSLAVAKFFGTGIGWIYLARLQGAVDCPEYFGSSTHAELMAYFLVPWTDIYAYRLISDNTKVWLNTNCTTHGLTSDMIDNGMKLLLQGYW